ncbi:MAG: CocE/NonD family hydrolase [Candidatus Dormibacteraeota bacterium]|nr:CocE/NonD family hydrolase [Candidatus Dormibacteraeota bacterium]
MALAALAQPGTSLPVSAAAPQAGVSGWGGWTARPATYAGVAIESNVPIVMSDGTHLMADVHHPADAAGVAAPGRLPVIVSLTAYNKQSVGPNFADDYLVKRGYVQVIVDARGTGSSAGQWQSFSYREQQDGYEIVQWAASPDRPWSDGRVGMHGASYGGISQVFTAELQPPALRSIFPVVPAGDVYRDIVFNGGQLDGEFMPFWLGAVSVANMVPTPPTTPAQDIAALQVELSHASAASSFQAAVVQNALAGGDKAYDGPFYRERSPLERIDRVRVPTFVTGGWNDFFQRSEPELYRRLRANGVPTRLLMGPWYHLSPFLSTTSGLPAEGVPAPDELELRWDDHYVRDVADPGLASTPEVTYHELNSGWTTAPQWPPPGLAWQPYYPGSPASVGSPGALSSTPPTGTGTPDTLPWTYLAGACSRSAVQWSMGATAAAGPDPCGIDNRTTDALGLAYDIPVTAPMHIEGPMSAHLFVESNQDTNVTVRVEDVAPDGSSLQVSAGYLMISERALDPSRSVTVQTASGGFVVRPYQYYSQATQVPVSAGQVVDMWVEIYNSAALVPAGHRLRMSVQTADSPHLLPNAVQAPHTAGAVLHLFHDRAHPSALVLPVISSAGASTTAHGGGGGPGAAAASSLPKTSGPLPGSGLLLLASGAALALLGAGGRRRSRA